MEFILLAGGRLYSVALREQERSIEVHLTGLHSGCGPWRIPHRRLRPCLAQPLSLASKPAVGSPLSEPTHQKTCLQHGPCPRAEPACCAYSSVFTHFLDSLFPTSLPPLGDNSGFFWVDPGFRYSPSFLCGNTGFWLISIFNLVLSSECPSSPRHSGVLMGTLLDIILYFHGHFSGV